MTIRPRAFLFLLVIGVAFGLGSACPARAEIVLRDDAGKVHHLAAAPARIVSLMPSLTESLCALGACDRLVGIDRFSNWPPQVDSLPRLGGLDDPLVERTVGLRPDVVLASTSSRINDRLAALGIEVFALRSDTHADAHRNLDLIARLLGRPDAGERLWADIEQRTAAAAARVPARWRGARVYFEVAATPYAAGAGSFIGQTLARLGLVNIAPPALGPFPQLNPEFIVRADPGLVIAEAAELRTMAARPGWQSLRALRRGQVCAFDSRAFDILVRPGPRLGEAAALVADCLQGLGGR